MGEGLLRPSQNLIFITLDINLDEIRRLQMRFLRQAVVKRLDFYGLCWALFT
jgi:hypothetical protein